MKPAPGTDWQAYARVYDLIAEHNPAYDDLVRRFGQTIRQWSPPPGSTLVDLGAGTGNFSLALAEAFPACRVLHIDGNPGMNAFAEAKAAARGLANVVVQTADIESVHFEPGSLAAVTAVHALYAFPDPDAVVRRMATWLEPGGHVFACDPGRVLDTGEWTRYILGATIRRHGLWRALRLYAQAAAGARQNRSISRQQAAGAYWTHTLADFRRAFEQAGLVVSTAYPAYRGCSDVVVANRPAYPPAPTTASARSCASA